MKTTRQPYQLNAGEKFKVQARNGQVILTSDELTFSHTYDGHLFVYEHEASIEIRAEHTIIVDLELPTEEGSYIFLNDIRNPQTPVKYPALAQLHVDVNGSYWHYFDANMVAFAVLPARIAKWQPATVCPT